MAGRVGERARGVRRSWARGSPWRVSSSRRSSRRRRRSPGWSSPRSCRREKHPQADKLRVCRVSTGQGEPLQIVCGAANARAGLKSALAVVGAKLPGDLTIKAAKLRGVESAGMLCSAKELGLADASSGIVELPADAPVGKPLREYLDLDDMVLELNVTPNRGDAMSVIGRRARGGGAYPVRKLTGLDVRDRPRCRALPPDCTILRCVPRCAGGMPELCRTRDSRRQQPGSHPCLDARAPAPRRRALHQSGRGCHQLRDARAGPAHARV